MDKLQKSIRRWEIRENFRRAVRLNSPRSFAELRSLYRSAASGVKFGLHSGYSP